MRRARDLGEAFGLIMKSRGWSQGDLARELGISQPWVSQIVRGRRDCRLNKAVQLLARVGWELHITPKSGKGNAEDDPVRRREFVAGAASVFFVPSPKTTPFHNSEYINMLTERTTRINLEIGGDSVVASVLSNARKVGSASLSGGRDLQSAAARFMCRASYVVRQAGRADDAVKLANQALTRAQRANDQNGQAQAFYALAFATGRRQHARFVNGFKANSGKVAMYAQRGLGLPEITDHARAYLRVCLARGLANVPGNERQAREEIERVLSIDGLSPLSRADLMGIAGNALRDARAYPQALTMLGDAARLSEPLSPFYQAVYLGDQTLIALNDRQPSRAAELMENLSYVIPLINSTEIERQAEHLLQAARPWETVPEIRDARARLQSVRVTNGAL